MSVYAEKRSATKNDRSTTAGFSPSPQTDREAACGVRGIVEEHSLLSTAVCFGAGLAMGTVLGRLLAGPPESSASFRRKVLDTVEQALPDALREKFRTS
jgi:hypothetical protein